MPRVPRIAFENGFFHIYNRGVARQPIFVEEGDYQKFLTKLQELNTKYDYDYYVYAYVLMPNHFHILMQTQTTPIATVMSSLLTSYSMYFNKKYDRVGPLFQGRFKSKLCDRETYFLGASRYISLNPIEAGIVEKLEDYPWSSYQEIFGNSAYQIINKKEVTRLIGKGREKDSYHQFIIDGMPILDSLKEQYTLNKQVEGPPKFNVMSQKQFLREKIKRKIDNWFKIRPS